MNVRVPIRWRIFLFLFAIGFLEYLQQRGLTVAAARIMPDLHFSQLQVGWLEQSFVVGYALFQLPGGVFGQRWGARWTFLAVGVVSILCIAGSVCVPSLLGGTELFAALLALQLVMGVAQAPTFPVSSGVFERWFAARRWPLVQGLQTMGLGLGGALAPPLIAVLMTRIGWRAALLWTALPAIPLFIAWAWYARNSPREHPAVQASELTELEPTQSEPSTAQLSVHELWQICRDHNALLLALAYFSMNYVYYLLGNWCFLYLVQERHFSLIQSGWLAMAPPVAAGVGAGVGGIVASRLYERFGSRLGLLILPVSALPVAGLLLLAAVHSGNAYTAVGMLTACYGIIELTEGSFWAQAMNVGRGNAMAVGGLMNTGGSLAGVVGIPIVAYLSGRGYWNLAFLIGTGAASASAVAWLFIHPARTHEPRAAVLPAGTVEYAPSE